MFSSPRPRHGPISRGFSLTEMLIALVFTLVIFACAYRFFTGHVSSQFREVSHQRALSQLQQSLEQLRQDIASMDATWGKYEIVPISYQTESSHIHGEKGDWLTLILPDTKFQTLMKATNFTPPDPDFAGSSGVATISPVENSADLAEGDFVMVYENTGSYGIYQLQEKYPSSNASNITGLKLTAATGPAAWEASNVHPGMKTSYESPTTKPLRTTLIQKIKYVTYRLSTGRVELTESPGGVDFSWSAYPETRLTRTVNGLFSASSGELGLVGGEEQLVGYANELKFSFDLKGTTTVSDVSSVADWSKVIAVNLRTDSEASSKGDHTFVAKFQIPGASPLDSIASGDLSVAATCEVSSKAIGQPVIETDGNGGSRLIVPAIQFDATDPDQSVGEVVILDAKTGQKTGSVGNLDYNGHHFLPTSLARMEDGSGLIAGGYYRDASDVMIPTFMHIRRDSTSKAIESDAQLTFHSFAPNDYLNDTVSIAVEKNYVYVASYAKQATQYPRIYRVSYSSGGNIGSMEHYTTDSTVARPDVLITALGTAAMSSGGQTTVMWCKTNPDPAVRYSGRVVAVYGDPIFSPLREVAMTDWPCSGIQTDRAYNYVAGRLSAHALAPIGEVNGLQRVNLDDATCEDCANPAYYDAYTVSNIAPTSACGTQTIRRLAGLALEKTSSQSLSLAVTNYNPSGSPRTNASTAMMRYSGVAPHVLATLDRGDNANANDRKIRATALKGTLDNPAATLPPGSYPNSSPTRTTATSPRCEPWPALSDSAGWLYCIRQKMTGEEPPAWWLAAAPTPTPTVVLSDPGVDEPAPGGSGGGGGGGGLPPPPPPPKVGDEPSGPPMIVPD